MKKIIKQIMILVMSLIMIPCVCTEVQAASMTFPKSIQTDLIQNKVIYDYFYVKNMPANGKISSVKISNSKIAAVSVYNSNGVQINSKKAGKAVLTVTVKYGTKTKKFRSTLKVSNYVNPIKSLSCNGYTLPSSLLEDDRVYTNTKMTSGTKFKIVPKSGWVIKGKRKQYGFHGQSEDKMVLVIRFYNKKSKKTEDFAIIFDYS